MLGHLRFPPQPVWPTCNRASGSGQGAFSGEVSRRLPHTQELLIAEEGRGIHPVSGPQARLSRQQRGPRSPSLVIPTLGWGLATPQEWKALCPRQRAVAAAVLPNQLDSWSKPALQDICTRSPNITATLIRQINMTFKDQRHRSYSLLH